MSDDPGLTFVAVGGFLAFVGLLIAPLDGATAVLAAFLGFASALFGAVIVIADLWRQRPRRP